MTVGERIRERRISLGLSQQELANRMGLTSNNSRSTISKLETMGDNITTDRVKAIAEALGCTPASLIGWEEIPEPRYQRPDESIIADFIFDKIKNKYIRKLYDVLGDITEEEGEELIRYAEFIASRRKEKDN